MKLTLVSVVVRGVRQSAFLMLPYVDGKVRVSTALLSKAFKLPPDGCTFSIGS